MASADPNIYFAPTYSRKAPAMAKAKGSYVFDEKGKKYLDFGTGVAVTALGHTHPAISRILKAQGDSLLHVSNHYFAKPQIDLAKLLVNHSFGDKVFLCNSGTEAIEAAIKFSRKWASVAASSSKYHVLSFSDGFHGRTYGALAATAQPKYQVGFGPMPKGFHYAPFNNIDATRSILDKYDFAAIIVEPLQGEGGINQATTKFLKFLREYATSRRIVLVFDEIQCGFGRTGTMWQYEQHRVVPDMMALAKPIGGGLPLGAVVSKKAFVKTLSPGDHGTTFGGNPLACALGCEIVKTIAKESFLSQVRQNGSYLMNKLNLIANGNFRIKEVVGTGLMIGVRMKEDPGNVVAACMRNGLLVLRAGHNTVRFMPPLTVTRAEIDKAVRIFGKVLQEIGVK